MKRQRPPPNTNCSVFFRGVPLYVTQQELRPHFESIGRVLEFRLMGPSPGKDFRYGEVDYIDEKTAQEAIMRLHGHAFGDQTMRVSLLDTRLRRRGRKEPPGSHSYSTAGRGGGGGWGSSSAGGGAGTTPTGPLTDDRGRPLMQFSRGFFDPVLGREDSMVLNVLKRTATEDAYEAVEQLRVLVMERPEDARRLLQDNPALISAVIMVLQHARRIPFGALPPEAFDTVGGGIRNGGIDATISSSTSSEVTGDHMKHSESSNSSNEPNRKINEEGSQDSTHNGDKNEGEVKGTLDSSTSSQGKDGKGLEGGAGSGSQLGWPKSGPLANTISSSTSSTEKNDLGPTIKITDTQRQQALQSIKKMRDEDVEKVLVLTPKDLEKVQNPQQRKQLQILQLCLQEMSRGL